MRFRDRARLDPSQVSDRRGRGVPFAIGGGGGLLGLVFLLVQAFAGGGGDGGLALGTEAPSADLAAGCQTGADANQSQDCRIVAVVNSVQAFWQERLPDYRPARTVLFSEATATACGNATSAVGPFYCPADNQVYIDLTFYGQLRERFGAQGGPFAQAYVIAHEYGHHVENLKGLLERSREGTGPQSGAVRVELMADCLAGAWAKGAVGTGFIEELTEADIRDGLDAAAAIGDDRIQEQVQGRVTPESFTHGSSEQRQRWFTTGYREGTFAACDTFAVETV